MIQSEQERSSIIKWAWYRRHLFQNILLSLIDLVLMAFLFFTLYGVSGQERVNHIIFLLIVLLTVYLYIRWRPLARAYWHKREAHVSRREQALERREQEMLPYYELVRAVNEVNDLRHQLNRIVHAIINNFSCYGVIGCAIYLRSEDNRPSLQAMAAESSNLFSELSHEDETIVGWVLTHGRTITVQDDGLLVDHAGDSYVRHIVSNTTGILANHERRILPLYKQGEVLGALYLVASDRQALQLFPWENELPLSQEGGSSQTAFSYKMLKLMIALIERAHTQQKMLENALVQRTKQMSMSVMSTLSHELRTPLTTLKGTATYLLSDETLWDDVERRNIHLENIKREVDHLDRFVAKLVDVSRIEGNTLKLKKELYYIDDLIHETITEMESRLQGRLPEVIIGESYLVELDTVLIGHVLENLIENAVRHTDYWTPIQVSAHYGDDHVIVTVADRGPGISSEERHHIFDKFHCSSNSSGLGLGLTICGEIIAAHDGRIWVDNREGGGALFQFSIPASKLGEEICVKE